MVIQRNAIKKSGSADEQDHWTDPLRQNAGRRKGRWYGMAIEGKRLMLIAEA